ncbi:MAG: TonB-dependent receptor, partial [Acidobacteria bacterium]|nr:TonB-dependent receptor [Acidobacteriota bacterium]
GPLDNSTAAPIGMGLASLLYGIPTGGNVSVNASRAQSGRFSALFFQDDFKIHPRLTVNLGLRWEYESPLLERHNRTIRNFDFVTPNPIGAAAAAAYAANPIPEVPLAEFRTIGGLTFAGVGGNPRQVWSGDTNNFAPRIGFAFQMDRKTVLRAGYGLFFAQIGADRRDVNQGGFNQATNIIPSNDNGQTFVASLANPFPRGIELPPGASQGLATFLGRGVSFFDPQPATPYMQRWSFSVQRQFPARVVLDVTYVGNRGNKLGVSQQFDPVPRRYLSTSPERDQPTIDYLSAQVANPFYTLPEFAGTGLGNQRVARSSLLSPFKHFSGVSTTQYFGYSWYHSLQVAAQKRMTRGFTIQVNCTWSKFMEATDRLNETDPYLEHVISDQDFPMRLTVSGIYELPIGRKRALGGNMNRLLDALAGGWQVQGWYEGQSGQALGFGNAILRGDLHAIPIARSERDIKRWFNTEAGFERSNQKQLSNNIRTFSSLFSGIRGDGINNLDASLFKNFRLTERFTAQFRLESYNALNHVQFANPNTTPTSTAFGTVTAEKGHGQRQVTFGVKLFF